MTITLTLQSIRNSGPCKDGWAKLLKSIGTDDMTTRIGIGDVLLSNGRADALWCLRALQPRERVSLVMPAVKRASAYTTDQRVHALITVIDRWLAGDDTVDLKSAAAAYAAAAYAAADAYAARAATYAARAATYAAHAAAADAAHAAAAYAAHAAAADAAAAYAAAAYAAADAYAARAATYAAHAAYADAAEIEAQCDDIMRMSPPLIMKGEPK